MDFLIKELPRSAEILKIYDSPDRLRKYVERFKNPKLRDERLKLGGVSKSWPALVAVLSQLMKDDGLDVPAPSAAAAAIKGTFDKGYETASGFFPKAGFPVDKLQLTYVTEISLDPATSTLLLRANADLPSWTRRLAGRLRERLDKLPPAADEVSDFVTAAPDKTSETSGTTILAPGLPLDTPFRGTLRDYSGCATEAELQDLKRRLPSGIERVLPLGRYHRFAAGTSKQAEAPVLYLPGSKVPEAGNWTKYPEETPAIYRGALIVAPQESGKTMLILRWLKAANACGYSQFIVDVKGNLYDKLKGKALKGQVYHFTTEPGAPSDRINFLAGLGKPTEPKLAWQVRQLANAILPSEGFDEGEQLYFLQNRTSWLCAMIHILKLAEYYWPQRFKDRRADLSDLYHLIEDPTRLATVIKQMLEHEQQGKAPSDTFGGVRRWILQAALLFTKDEVPGGQRPDRTSYQELTQGLLIPLMAFGQGGVLHEKIRDDISTPKGRLFELEALDRDEPITIIMTAREQELDDATTVVSMAVKRLQQILFERMGKKRRPVLLLLDETRRIRNFKPGQYITFAREAQAGCVIVYQSLEQIKDEAEVAEILENVGTQIYLKRVVGGTARRFIEFLPKRYRKSFSRSDSMNLSGEIGGTWNEEQELIDYFNTGDLYRLPAGTRSALVYLDNHPSGKPFIVDMDEERVPELS